MATIKDLIFAVDETQKKYPENTFFRIYSTILSGKTNGYNYITSTNNARNNIKAIPNHEIIKIIATELVRIYNYAEIVRRMDPDITGEKHEKIRINKLKNKCPYYDEIVRFVMDMKNHRVNSILYFLTNNANLIDALAIIEKYHYGYGKKYREILDYYDFDKNLPHFCETELINKINNDDKRVFGIKQVQVNQNAINKCVADIISGAQIRNGNNSYQVGKNLFASQHIGKKRKNQEDSVLIMEHSKNPDFKILVVSDGMGGGEAGEEVSRYAVKRIADWFSRINPECYNYPEIVQEAFNEVIKHISQKVYEKYNTPNHINAGATFTGAIVTKNQTIITQIGDSRAYIVKDDKFIKKSKASLITQDESVVWPYEGGKPINPMIMGQEFVDEIRFLRHSNFVLRCIGDKTDANAQSFRIPNNCYDKLILMSDGASDLLSMRGIEIICQNTPLEKIADMMVFTAVNKKAIHKNTSKEDKKVHKKAENNLYEKISKGTLTKKELEEYNNSEGDEDEKYMSEIAAGKDNTTVAVFGKEESGEKARGK